MYVYTHLSLSEMVCGSEALQDAGDSVSSDAAKQLKGMKAGSPWPRDSTNQGFKGNI